MNNNDNSLPECSVHTSKGSHKPILLYSSTINIMAIINFRSTNRRDCNIQYMIVLHKIHWVCTVKILGTHTIYHKIC